MRTKRQQADHLRYEYNKIKRQVGNFNLVLSACVEGHIKECSKKGMIDSGYHEQTTMFDFDGKSYVLRVHVKIEEMKL